MSTAILGLHGPAGCGKSTLAALLQARGYHRISCAAPIRCMLAALLREAGIDEDRVFSLLHTQEGKKTPIPQLCDRTPRELLQTLGTEWGRDRVSPSLWTDLMIAKISAANEDLLGPSGIVIDDVRFQEEVDALHSIGGEVVRILPWAPCAATLQHRSEQPLECHHTVASVPGDPAATLDLVLAALAGPPVTDGDAW
jgi:energy-coupling factor transporter ATP-binding protein EcfA2